MNLEQFNDAVLADLKEIPHVATCERYAGQFDASEVKRVSFTAPALFFACLGGEETDLDPMTGQTLLKVRCIVFVVAKNARGRDTRKSQALSLAEAVLLRARKQRWNTTYAEPVEKRRLENLYSPATDKTGMALWSVTWEQTLCLGENTWAEEDPEIDEICVGWAPNIGAGHEQDYTSIDGAQS